MSSVLRFCMWLTAASFLALAGCEIETVGKPESSDSPAGTLVVNEVFTLPVTEPTRYNWIEFLNAGQDTVDLTGWTLEYTTYQLRTNIDIAIFPNGGFLIIQVFPTRFTGYGRFQVPFASLSPPSAPGEEPPPIRLAPFGLMTIVDNESRMKDVTDWGPGNTQFEYITNLFYGQVDSLDTLLYVPDSVTVFRGGFSSYAFAINPTEQLVLRNPAGTVVDVVRFGGYSPTGVDPYPGNQSLGVTPPFESVYRYAGGYKTNNPVGNTANDFAITNQFVRPIPHWYSQPHKQ
jgi:hypothetical protein